MGKSWTVPVYIFNFFMVNGEVADEEDPSANNGIPTHSMGRLSQGNKSLWLILLTNSWKT
jgi:hypothetical protein